METKTKLKLAISAIAIIGAPIFLTYKANEKIEFLKAFEKQEALAKSMQSKSPPTGNRARDEISSLEKSLSLANMIEKSNEFKTIEKRDSAKFLEVIQNDIMLELENSFKKTGVKPASFELKTINIQRNDSAEWLKYTVFIELLGFESIEKSDIVILDRKCIVNNKLEKKRKK